MQGIEIVTPEERKASNVAAAMREADQLRETIKFVVIPADTAKPIEERSLTLTLSNRAVDSFVEQIKPMFVVGGDKVDVTLLQQTQGGSKLLSSSSSEGAMPQVSHETLMQVAKDAHVESFTLVHPTPSNKMTTVLMYLDEVGMLKRLPLNKRASDFATRAGFNPPPQFYGDIVLSRVQYAESSRSAVMGASMKHPVDMTLSDARLDAEWLTQGAIQNLEYQRQFNEATGTRMEQPPIQGTEGSVSVEKDYIWTQTEEELEVRVALNDDSSTAPVNKKDIKIRFGSQSLQVLAPKLISIELFERVDVDSCTWTLERNEVVISMEKQEAAFWPRILN